MACMPGAIQGVALLACLWATSAIYLPGANPEEYTQGKAVELKVNKLTSAKTQLPYDYYYLPFCKEDKIEESARTLGEILKGDKIQSSPYKIFFNVSERCKLLCPTKKLDREDKDKFRSMIDDEYYVNWMVDGLEGATQMEAVSADDSAEPFTVYSDGFPLGQYDSSSGRFYLHNHVTLMLEYHNDPSKFQGNRVVGFMIAPRSIKHTPSHSCDEDAPFDIQESDQLTFTYDVMWKYSSIRWVHRWDLYRQNVAGQVHWFAISNSLLIVLLLSAMVAMILLRTLHRDIAYYNDMSKEEAAEETGWKLVYGDVFRKPPHFVPLVVSVGSGMQLLGMSVVTMGLSLIGLLSPSHRGNILQSLLLLFAIMGMLAGYVAGRLTKLVDENSSQMVSWLTGTLYPGAFFIVFFMLNLLLFGEGSSGAVPFNTLFFLLVLWFGVSVPLVLLGFRKGFLMDPIELPVKTSAIPREIPEQPLLSNPALMALAGGLLAFSAIFTELFFIMRSIWQHHFYYLFGFLALVLVILTVMCAEVSIALTYFQLTSADYRWWWNSFCASGSSGLYMFIYAIIYFESRLEIDQLVSMILYFSYMGIASVMLGLLTGSIGFLSAFFFVRAIYGSVKID
mmetsp:Transcript_20745/g.37739  ORF Transcript_20745/g.37739 Transcript_20745/m.37739 type:complete len:620 (-) Transcript_20745:58-1917(-)